MGPLLLKQSSPLIGEAKVLQLYKTDLDLDIYIYMRHGIRISFNPKIEVLR